MAAGEKTIKVKFTGETRDLDRASRKALRDIEKMNKGIIKSVGDTADEIPSLFSTVVEGLPPQGKLIAGALVAGLAVSLAPALGAAISSAVLLAAGGGVLALGIKAAIDDPKVTKAFDGLKKKASKIFDDFGKPFVDPLVRAAKTIGNFLDEIRPQIVQLGKTIAPVIDKLTPALTAFLKNMLPGIQKAVEASVPLWNTLADKLPQIGTAIGKFFDLISQNGDDTNQFVSDLIDFISGLIISLGWVISKLTSMYSAFRSFFVSVGSSMLTFTRVLLSYFGMILDAAVRAFGWIPGIGGKLKSAQAEFSKFRANVNNELNKIQNKSVYVNVFSNVWSVVGEITNALKGIGAIGKGKPLSHRAMGGSVAAGQSYVVGENGPEILTMGSNGYITPNHKIGSDTPVIQVFIGDQELTQLVDVRVQKNNRQMARQLKAA